MHTSDQTIVVHIWSVLRLNRDPVQVHSQDGVVPEDTDGLGTLLGGHQAELHCDGFVQVVLKQRVVVVDRDADHRGVDDWTLGNPEGRQDKRPSRLTSRDLYWSGCLGKTPPQTLFIGRGRLYQRRRTLQ